jgi:hypothetical protein
MKILITQKRSSTSKENGVRRGKFGGSILFAVEDIEQT